MLNLILGTLGSGKTFFTDKQIIDALSKGKSVTLLVPEQEAIEAENRIYDRATAFGAPIENLTVVSFRRLANSVFRKHGGIEYDNIGESGRLIVLYRIVEQLSDKLKIYNKPEERSLIELLLSVCSELKRYCVEPSALTLAAENASSEHLKNKLCDIALIYGEYSRIISEKYADSSDDVNRLADIYATEKPSSSELFFVDSFNGFTAPEFRVLSSLIRFCNVTVSLTVPEKSNSIGYYTLEKTKEKLLNTAKELNVGIKTFQTELPKSVEGASEFSLIRSKLFDNAYTSPNDNFSERITLASCTDSFVQAEYIAQKICTLIRNGARYKDIAVITRNADRYEGVLDSIFEKYGIPVFLSKRNKLTDTAIYRAINDALSVIYNRFDTTDVLSYIKSGICGFTPEETDLLESYTSLWEIDGKRWTEKKSWTMNPYGFTDNVTDDGKLLLEKINSLRNRVITPLTELSKKLSEATVKDACKALYEFISVCGINEYYMYSTVASDTTAYNAFISLLDTLVLTASELTVNAQKLSSLIYLMAKNTDYGSIPSTLDCVTAGDASIIRCNEIKHVFLTDCENGVFPAGASDESFFSDMEKSCLSRNGIELSPNTNEKNDLEAFYFLRAASGAKETLTATYCNSNGKSHISSGFKRLCELFPANTVFKISASANPLDKIQSLESFKYSFKTYKSSKYSEIIKKLATDFDVEYGLSASLPITSRNEYISPEIVSSLFGKKINMSYSKYETYVCCPFSYFCKYVLKLKKKKYGYFASVDMGNYIHRILEKSLQKLFSGGDLSEKNSESIESALTSSFEEVVSSIVGGELQNEGKRFSALISRLKHTVTFITENILSEFKNSDFEPKFFELEIGNKSGNIPPLEISVDDDSTMYIQGKIDRVDTFVRNGKIYVKILDYKSGNTEHSMQNVKYGLDTQMLLYLFSIWKDKSTSLAKMLECDGYEIMPAAVLYQKVSLPVTSTHEPLSEAEITEKAYEKLVRNGVLLEDIHIISAMEHDIAGKFLPVTAKNDGLNAKSDTLISLMQFENLYKDITEKLAECGKKMKSGQASAVPLQLSTRNPCKYCEMYPVCRSKTLRCDDEQ